MAKDLRAILARKDEAHYGVATVGAPTARVTVRRARSLVDAATRFIDR